MYPRKAGKFLRIYGFWEQIHQGPYNRLLRWDYCAFARAVSGGLDNLYTAKVRRCPHRRAAAMGWRGFTGAGMHGMRAAAPVRLMRLSPQHLCALSCCSMKSHAPASYRLPTAHAHVLIPP